jgi:PKD repeat protein
MKRNIIYLFGMLVATLAIASCKKENSGGGTKAVFSYVADGFKVNFTNFSTNATEFSWDFGDGSGVVSTSKAPLHIFTKKGDFLVSLTAKNGTETSTFVDTVSIIGPNIRIDGDFSDWQYVAYSHENSATSGGTLMAVKTFASSSDIYFYLEGTPDMKLEIFDMYVDADNKPTTGFSTFLYPAGSGADILLEGPAVKPGWGAVYAHSGPPSGFTFSPTATFDDTMNFSAIVSSGGKNKIEFSIKKSALGKISGFVNFAFIDLSSGYAELGKIPEAQTPTSRFIAIPL